jgi:hypothetical protein
MDLDRISKLTSLPIRRLRYVLEHRVLPGAERRSKGHRVTRRFSEFEAFGIACATATFEAGLRRPVVALLMSALTKRSPTGVPLQRAFEGAADVLEIADGVNMRLVEARGERDWVQMATGTALRKYAPMATLRLDIGRLRRAVQGHEPRGLRGF